MKNSYDKGYEYRGMITCRCRSFYADVDLMTDTVRIFFFSTFCPVVDETNNRLNLLTFTKQYARLGLNEGVFVLIQYASKPFSHHDQTSRERS